MNREVAIQIAREHIKKWEKLASSNPSRVSYVSSTASPNTLVYAYTDGRGFSIGWGSYDTLSDGTKVTRGFSITKARADAELDYELREIEKGIFPKIKRPLTETQYAAILDTAYNAGPGSLSYTSNKAGDKFTSLLTAINSGQDTTNIFPKVAITDSGTGKVLTSLVNRRKDAAELWNGKYDTLYQQYLRIMAQNPNLVNYTLIGGVLVGIGVYLYILKKKGKI